MKRTFFIASIVALSALSASAQDSNTEYSAADLLAEKKYRFKPTHNTISFYYVTGKITSDVYVGDSKKAIHPSLEGYGIAYEHLFGGVNGQHGFRITGAYGYGGNDDPIGFTLDYIGAAYVYNYTTTLGFVWSLSAGMGWSLNVDDAQVKRRNEGFGAVLGVGCDYKICRYVGIGAEIRYRTDRFPAPESVKLKDNESFGYKHISLLIGPRFYF